MSTKKYSSRSYQGSLVGHSLDASCEVHSLFVRDCSTRFLVTLLNRFVGCWLWLCVLVVLLRRFWCWFVGMFFLMFDDVWRMFVLVDCFGFGRLL